jgi:hypothetical protein
MARSSSYTLWAGTSPRRILLKMVSTTLLLPLALRLVHSSSPQRVSLPERQLRRNFPTGHTARLKSAAEIPDPNGLGALATLRTGRGRAWLVSRGTPG